MKFHIETINDSFVCSELQLSNYKEILKSSFGDKPNFRLFCNAFIEILEQLTDKNKDYFEEMSIVDFLLIVFEIAINSQGDEKQLSITLEEDKKANLTFNLDLAKQDILNIYREVFGRAICIDNISIKLNCPSIKRVDNTQKEENLYIQFIESISYKNETFKFKTNEQADKAFETLSPKAALKVIESFSEALQKLSNNNLLERYNLKDHKILFVPTPESFMWFVKLLFNEPLDVFYDNVYYLARLGNFNLEYLDRCSPGEYMYFVNKLRAEQSQKNSQTSEGEEFVSDEALNEEDFTSGLFTEQI